jgi:hypothetical protein
MEFISHQIESDFKDVGSIRAADLDSDGDLDLVGASGNPGSIVWWENLDVGSGSFYRMVIDPSFDEAYDIVAADFDGDLDPDILGGTYFGEGVAWWENVEADSFPKSTIDAGLKWAQSVFAIDMDGDEDMDAVAGTTWDDDIFWFENDGSGSFVKKVVTTDAFSLSSIFAVDMEKDGDVDVIGISSSTVAWWENDGEEGFTKHDMGGDFSFGDYAIAADLDGDEDVDVITSDKYGNEISWWENDSIQGFTKNSIDADIGWANWLHAADLDNDGDLDLLAASHTDGAICMYENLGSKNFQKRIISEDLYGASFVNAADLDNDGDLDVIGASSSLNDIFWWENTLVTNPNPVDPELEIDPDQLLTVIGPDDPDTTLSVFVIKNTGNGTLIVTDIANDADWLTIVDTTAFMVTPGAEQEVTIQCDASGMLNGIYETVLIIYSNDPADPVYELSLSLEMKGGQEVNFVDEIEPNNRDEEAQLLFGPSPAGVKGTVSVSDAGNISIQGDDVEDLYRFTLESSYLKIYLYNTEADLDLFLLTIEGNSTTIRGSNHRGGIVDEVYEIDDLEPGTYHVGVSIYDDYPLKDNSTYDLAVVGDLQADPSVSIREYSFRKNDDQAFQIYPNPVIDQLHVSTRGAELLSIEIYSATGHVIYNRQVETSACSIDLSFLSGGVYFIKIKSNNFISTKKIIKL